MPKFADVDVIVVGAGVLGSFTALHLRQHGYNVLLADRYPLQHSLGSSHGESRVIRAVYPAIIFSKLMIEAYAGWHQLEKESKRQLLVQTGSLEMAPKLSPTGAAVRKAAAKSREPITMMSAETCLQSFGVSVPPTYVAWHFPRSGVLRARQCVAALHAAFVAAGGTVLEDASLVSMKKLGPRCHELSFTKPVPPGGSVAVRARSVVLATGAWLGSMARDLLGVQIALKPWKVHVHYLRLADGVGSPGGPGTPSRGGALGPSVRESRSSESSAAETSGSAAGGGGGGSCDPAVASTTPPSLPQPVIIDYGIYGDAATDDKADGSSTAGSGWDPPHPVYSIPPLERPGQIKVAAHAGAPVADMGGHSWAPDPSSFRTDGLQRWCASRVPGLLQPVASAGDGKAPAGIEPCSTESCLYTMTADEHFVLGPLPRRPKEGEGAESKEAKEGVKPIDAALGAAGGSTAESAGAGAASSGASDTTTTLPASDWDPSIVLVGGGSGHAFKLAPVLGRMAADYVKQALNGDVKGGVSVASGGEPFLKWLRAAKHMSG